jgi:hypothetical protein
MEMQHYVWVEISKITAKELTIHIRVVFRDTLTVIKGRFKQFLAFDLNTVACYPTCACIHASECDAIVAASPKLYPTQVSLAIRCIQFLKRIN